MNDDFSGGKDVKALTSEVLPKQNPTRKEILELVASYAQDVVDYWPQLTFRTIRVMIPKMQVLKEALEMME